ncbi:MAG TPA: hypothetical protein VGK61_01060 [Planctomycetota bacterium]|jgi:hypothetical protein
MARPILVLALVLLPGCAEVKPGFRPEEAPWSRDTTTRPPRGHLRVTLNLFEVAAKDRAALQGVAKFAAPEIAVAGAPALETHGILIVPGKDNLRASVDADLRRTGSMTTQTVFMVMLPNEEARIEVYRESPVERPVEVPLYKDKQKAGTATLEAEAGGFLAKAKKLPRGLLEMRLTPWFRSPAGKEKTIAEAAADVVLDPGRPYALFVKQEESESVGSLLLSRGSGLSRRYILLVLTVEEP